MSAPLFDKLSSYAKEDNYSFHMPGHKGFMESLAPCFNLDFTELPGLDDLHNPKGVISEAEDMCAQTFGARKCFFLINGSSCGIISAILSLGRGKKILVGRNAHKSVISGIILSGGSPSYIMPEIVPKTGLSGGITPDAVSRALEENPDAAGIIITSPTFEGIVSDIQKISHIAHSKNIPLIVDQAHGAHFGFSESFPKTAVRLGADMVIVSLHKTLPSFGQTALLLLGSRRVNEPLLKEALAITQTSSPSYIFMSAIDRLRELLDTKGAELFDAYEKNLFEFRKKVESFKSLKLIPEKLKGEYGIFDMDLGKLVFCLKTKALTGYELGNMLKKYKIEVEMVSERHIVALTGINDKKHGFLNLYSALSEIDKNLSPDETLSSSLFFYPPKTIFSPRDAFFSPGEAVTLKNALGRISKNIICPYPPGIPLAAPGEEITPEILNALDFYLKNNVSLYGVSDGKISVIQIF